MSHLKWEKQQQFHAIEVIALWEGRVTRRHLKEIFNIRSSTTSAKLFQQYNEKAPGNLKLSTTERGNILTEKFEPHFSDGKVDEYLALLARHPDLNPNVQGSFVSSGFIETIRMPSPAVSPAVIRSVVQAIQSRVRLDIWYFSQSTPDGSERIIVPHTLVYSGMRWHVRAWCELKGRFTDFVLTRMRINGLDLSSPQEESAPERDDQWNNHIEIVIGPNPKLTAEQQGLVCKDFGFTIEQPLVLTARRALIHYQLLAMNIYLNHRHFTPKAHPLIVINRDEIAPYTFDE